jgi:predicted metalloprotease
MAVGAGIGIPGIALLLLFMFLNNGNDGGGGPDIDDVLGQLQQPGAAPATTNGPDPDDRLVDLMSFVLDDVQRFWGRTFSDSGERYRRADLILFTQSTNSACGGATADIGPHYCPADEKVYLDLDFFRELRTRFGAPGDFAQAYVLAHEIGHHVQNLLGINEQVERAQRSGSADANELSVLLELQADCLAGVWGHTARDRGLLEAGDLKEGLQAAASVGDDRIQEQAGQRVDPETWTHGSSEQRVDWFTRGFESGDPSNCDTFGD